MGERSLKDVLATIIDDATRLAANLHNPEGRPSAVRIGRGSHVSLTREREVDISSR